MMMGNGGGIAVVLEYVDAFPPVCGKIPILQVFRWDRILPFGNQQIFLVYPFFVNSLQKFIEAGLGSLGQPVIAIKNLAFVQLPQAGKHLLFMHGIHGLSVSE